MTDEQAPHTNLGLERTVLGHMIGCHSYTAYLSSGLTREDFYRQSHRWVFEAIEAVERQGAEADMVSVGLELRRANHLEEVGVVYFSRLADDVITPPIESVILFAAELATLAARRELAAALEKSQPLEDIASRLDRSIQRGPEERRTFDSAAQLEAIRQDIARDKVGRVWLGLPTLDNILDGLRPGEVFGLMARPGIGKTMLLGHVARAAADTDFGHVFFSLEMPAAQIVQRLASAHYALHKIPFRDRLAAGAIDSQDYVDAFKRFIIVDTPGLDVARMAARLRQIQSTQLKGISLRLVTIDHLGLIGGDRKMTTYDRVSTQAREIKELAKRFECTVLLAIQVNREAGGDGSKELGLGAARDSGVVEEAMDYLVAMRRLDRSQTLSQADRDRYRDVLFAKVVKNRHGTPDTEIAIRLDTRTLRLEEDPDLQIAEDDLTRIAANAGRGRR